jgi:hypothetical protein
MLRATLFGPTRFGQRTFGVYSFLSGAIVYDISGTTIVRQGDDLSGTTIVRIGDDISGTTITRMGDDIRGTTIVPYKLS